MEHCWALGLRQFLTTCFTFSMWAILVPSGGHVIAMWCHATLNTVDTWVRLMGLLNVYAIFKPAYLQWISIIKSQFKIYFPSPVMYDIIQYVTLTCTVLLMLTPTPTLHKEQNHPQIMYLNASILLKLQDRRGFHPFPIHFNSFQS